MPRKMNLAFLMEDLESKEELNGPGQLYASLISKLIRLGYDRIVVENKALDILQVCYALKADEDFRLRYYQKEIPLGAFLQ